MTKIHPAKIQFVKTMRVKKFSSLLSIYGADLARWDAEDAAAARALLAESSAAREIYRAAEALDHALNILPEPSVPAGLPTRAANEALLRAGRTQVKRTPARRARRFAPAWGGAVALALVLLAVFPAGRGPHDVTKFMHTMDKIASRSNQELRDTDEVLGMLAVADATQGGPEHADENGAITSEELINTLFDNDAAEDADGASL